MSIEPGKVHCLRCKHRDERIDEYDFHCAHPAFETDDFLGLKKRPFCSNINAAKNCNGFESKEEKP